jgi:hypothetical protein
MSQEDKEGENLGVELRKGKRKHKENQMEVTIIEPNVFQ